MIKFFRKLREKTLSDNSFGKYLTYAIGEIVLVVIGILIALQVNNWNVERLNKKEEQSYLITIKRDLEQDSLYLKHLLKNIDVTLSHLNQIQLALNSNDTEIEQDVQFTGSLLSTFSFIPEKTTIENLKSSGKLTLIENNQVRDSILSYYYFIDTQISAYNTSLISYSREIIAPFLMTNFNLEYAVPENFIIEDSKIVNLNSEQKQSQFLRNTIKYRILILSVLKSNYKDLINHINRIQEMLNKEIKK